MTYRTSLYIANRGYDSDLIEIIHQVGVKTFNRIVKLCLLSLYDSSCIEKAKNLYKQSVNNERYEFGALKRIEIVLCLQSDEYDRVRYLLSRIEGGKKSGFIKQVVRYVLSAEIIYPLFLCPDITLQKQNYTHLILDSIAAGPVKAKKKRRRAVKRNVVATSKPQKETGNVYAKPSEDVWEPMQDVFPEADITVSPIDDFAPELPQNMQGTKNISEEDEMLALLSGILG